MIRRGFLLVCGFFMSGVVFYGLCVHAAAQMAGPESPETPYQVPGTSLIVLSAESYSGIYVEDGTTELVENVAAVVLRNDGPCTVARGEVTLCFDKTQWRFVFTVLPPGASVFVMEADRQHFSRDLPKSCTGWAAYEKLLPCPELLAFPMEDSVWVVNSGPLSTGPIQIQFKSYDEKREMYLGGITYEINLMPLQPGERRQTMPWYYSREESRIVAVRIYPE